MAQSTDKDRDHKGSRARCLVLTEGSDAVVAVRLQSLAGDAPVIIPADRTRWMPRGFADGAESLLRDTDGILPDGVSERMLIEWWLAHSAHANVPNWDLAARFDHGESQGLLLVEAKAHVGELSRSGKGASSGSDNSEENAKKIGQAIAEASEGLNATHPGFNLSAKKHYQLANRLAWAWKLASKGVPVVLVYLGFLNASEMAEDGSRPFATAADWEQAVRDYARGMVPEDVWNSRLDVGGTPLWVRIEALDKEIPEAWRAR